MEKITNENLSDNEKINYEEYGKKIIFRFKKLLSFINEKYKIEEIEQIDLEEFKKDMESSLKEMEELRTLNAEKNFRMNFSEFSGFIAGGIHDIRNAVQFMFNQVINGEKVNFSSYLKRFVNFAELYTDRKTMIDFIEQGRYKIFTEIKSDLDKLIADSLFGINYKIYIYDFADNLEIKYNKTALFLLFNELATNFNKYGENPKVNIYFSEDKWGINWENDLKKNLDENLHSTNEGTKILEKAMKALGGNVLENEVKDGIYYFKAEVLVEEEF